MSARDDDAEGIRGTELADDVVPDSDAPPSADTPAEGIRGDGLADGAAGRPEHDPDEAAEGGIRGDGLATDA